MLFHITPVLYLAHPRDGERNQIAPRLGFEGCLASRCSSAGPRPHGAPSPQYLKKTMWVLFNPVARLGGWDGSTAFFNPRETEGGLK